MEWENTNTVNESGGSATIGDDASGDEAILFNTSAATYDILDNSGIGLGASTASYIKNAGLFEKTGGTATSAIAPPVTNTGTIEVSCGNARFAGEVPGRDRTKSRALPRWSLTRAVSAGQTFPSSAGAANSNCTPQRFRRLDQRLRHGRSQIERHDRGRQRRGPIPASRRTRGARREPWGSPTAQAPSASRSSAITTPPTSLHQTQANGSTLITYHGVSGLNSLLSCARSACGHWGAGASWDGSVGHGPGSST